MHVQEIYGPYKAISDECIITPKKLFHLYFVYKIYSIQVTLYGTKLAKKLQFTFDFIASLSLSELLVTLPENIMRQSSLGVHTLLTL